MKFIRRLFALWHARRRAMDDHETLSGLDTRTLRDLGLDRSQLRIY